VASQSVVEPYTLTLPTTIRFTVYTLGNTAFPDKLCHFTLVVVFIDGTHHGFGRRKKDASISYPHWSVRPIACCSNFLSHRMVLLFLTDRRSHTETVLCVQVPVSSTLVLQFPYSLSVSHGHSEFSIGGVVLDIIIFRLCEVRKRERGLALCSCPDHAIKSCYNSPPLFASGTLSLFDSLVIPRVVTRRLEASRQTCALLPQSTRGQVVVYPAPVKAHRQVPDVSAPALCLTKRP
jgi:hypothetical protein